MQRRLFLKLAYLVLVFVLQNACAAGGAGGGTAGTDNGSGSSGGSSGGSSSGGSSSGGGVGGSTSSPANLTYPNDQSAVGMNITAFNYYSPEWPFVNELKKWGYWTPRCDSCSNTGGVLNNTSQATSDNPLNSTQRAAENADMYGRLDQYGYPTSLPTSGVSYRSVSTILFGGSGSHQPSGQYIVLYDGEGTITYSGGVYNNSLSRAGRHVVDVNFGTTDNVLLIIRATDPNHTGNYIRNIRFIWPGGICNNDQFDYAPTRTSCESRGGTYTSFEENHETQVFHPKYLNDLRKFRSLRFMQMMRTNDSNGQVLDWPNRPLPGDMGYGDFSYGPPVEIMMELSNRIHADPWVNMPTRGTDAYFEGFAEVALETLDPDLKIYVEYGNEVWNDSYPYSIAANWIQANANTRWGVNSLYGRMNWFGMKSADICSIWKRVWGSESNRVVCVMGGFTGGASTYNTWALSCPLYAAEDGSGGVQNCASQMDVLATGPYFGSYIVNGWNRNRALDWASQGAAGLNRVFSELTNGGEAYIETYPGGVPTGTITTASTIDLLRTEVSENFLLSKQYGMDLVAYEGGQHLIGINLNSGNASHVALADMIIDVNDDPRMGDVFKDYLTMWREEGGQLFMLFESTQQPSFNYGAFGIRSYQDDDDSPKWLSTIEWIDENPCWWEGCEADNDF